MCVPCPEPPGTGGRSLAPEGETEDRVRWYCGPWDGRNVCQSPWEAGRGIQKARHLCRKPARTGSPGLRPLPQTLQGHVLQGWRSSGHQVAMGSSLARWETHAAPYAVGTSPVSQCTSGPELPTLQLPPPCSPPPHTHILLLERQAGKGAGLGHSEALGP